MKQDAANTLAILGIIKKKVAELETQYRYAVIADTEPGEKRNAKAGTDRTAQVYMSDPAPAWRVTDRDAFVKWIETHRPDEIVTTSSVRESFEKAVRADGGVIDEATGEVVEVPGLSLVPGNPTLTVKLDRDADRTVMQWMADEGMTAGEFLDEVTVAVAQIEAGRDA